MKVTAEPAAGAAKGRKRTHFLREKVGSLPPLDLTLLPERAIASRALEERLRLTIEMNTESLSFQCEMTGFFVYVKSA